MMKKIITGLTIAATSLIVSIGTPSFNFVTEETIMTAEAAGKVLSMEGAADKVIKTAHKAYEQKKKLSTTVTIKCSIKKSVAKNERKLEKAISKYEDKLEKAIAKEELGEFSDDDYLSRQVMLMVYPSYEADFSDGNEIDSYKVTYKNGKLTLAVTYPGDIESWRYRCEEIIYGKQNTEELRELVDGMSEVEKAWRVATWLMCDHDTEYGDGHSLKGIREKCVAENRAHGVCSDLHDLYMRYATRMGLKVLGIEEKGAAHIISAVGIGDEIYFLDMQCVKVYYEFWKEKISRENGLEMPNSEFFMRDLTLDNVQETSWSGNICIREWRIVTDSKKYEKIYEEAVKGHQSCSTYKAEYDYDDWGTDCLWMYEDEYEDF